MLHKIHADDSPAIPPEKLIGDVSTGGSKASDTIPGAERNFIENHKN
jgi:hypothetical protein